MDESLKRFKREAKMLHKDFEDIEKLDRAIREIEQNMQNVRGSWNFGNPRIRRDQNRSDLHFLELMERKNALIEKKKAFEAHIKWVIDVIMDCPAEYHYFIFECFVMRKKTDDFLDELYGTERASNMASIVSRSVSAEITKVLTPERIAELDEIREAMTADCFKQEADQ